MSAMVAAALFVGPSSAVGYVHGVATMSVDSAGQRARTTQDHVVVWDAADDGVDIRAARVDGTGQRHIFRQARGFVANLTLSRDGTQVAFSPERRGKPARLIVARTDGTGSPVNLLSAHPRLEGVGPLAWSASGTRVAFEGFVDEDSAGSFYPQYLFTIRTDGTRLKRHLLLDDGRGNGAVFGAMAWTRHGIVYPDDDRIVLLRGNTRRTLALNAADVAPSGNNQWVYFRRFPRPPKTDQTLWRIRPDGTELQRVATANPHLGDLLSVAPNFWGTRLLAQRTDGSESHLISFAPDTPRLVAQLSIPSTLGARTWR